MSEAPSSSPPRRCIGRGRRFPIDVNNDGRIDLFVPADNSEVSDNRLLINTGTKLVAQTYGVEENGGRVECGLAHDFDRDGFTDLALCRGVNFVMWRNQNGASFVKNNFGMSSLPAANAIAMADFDRDGIDDLVLVTDKQLQVRLHRAGKYSSVTWSKPLVAGVDVVTPDVNGDGRPDLYVVQASSGSGSGSADADLLFVNNGSPTNWTKVPVPQAAQGRGDSAVVLPDLWSSGHDAVLVSNGYYGQRGPRQVLAIAGLTP